MLISDFIPYLQHSIVFQQTLFKPLIEFDRSIYEPRDLMLLNCMDTLTLMDLRKKEIIFCDEWGEPFRFVPLQFQWSYLQRIQMRIIKDAAQNKFYIHRRGSWKPCTVQEVDMHTGMPTGPAIILERSFATNVKINNGTIYYLWQQHGAAATQQLFAQKM